jgi:hypothetical protein
MFLEMFVPKVIELREKWFPFASIQSFCDPNGESPSSHGMKTTAAEYLRMMEVNVVGAVNGNDAGVRDRAIQAVAGRMHRGLFLINPRCVEFTRKGEQIEPRESRLVVTAFKTGYVWNEKRMSPQNAPNIRIPRKGTRYDHTMNCVEYIVVGARIQPRVVGTGLQSAKERHGRQQQALAARARALILERGASVDDPRFAQWESDLIRIFSRERAKERIEQLTARERIRALRRAQRDDGESFRWDRGQGHRRGGYIRNSTRTSSPYSASRQVG